MNANKTQRRESTLGRLQAQLKSGIKPLKEDGKDTGKTIKLTEKDIERIKKEITTLKERV